MYGLDDAVQVHLRPGISEREFAQQATEMLAVTGVRPLIDAALPALEPAERDAWLAAEHATDNDDLDDDDGPWSNLDAPGSI